MVHTVPMIDFIHALRHAGSDVNFQEVVDDPARCWQALPSNAQKALLGQLGMDADAGAVSGMRAVKRRRKAPSEDNVYVLIETAQREGLQKFLMGAREKFLFEPLAMDGSSSNAPSLGRLPEARNIDDFIPDSVFTEGAAVARRRPVIEVLDEAWGDEPYDVERDGLLLQPQPLADFEELERYDVEPPFAAIVILRNTDGEAVYHIEEPPLSEMETALMTTLNERLRDILIVADEEPEDRARYVVERVFDLLPQYRSSVNRATAYRLGYYFLRNLVGFGRIEPVMRDAAIEDISCNGPALPVYVVHGRHGNMPTSLVFEELELTSFTIKLAQRGGKLLSVAQPLMDATLPDGSRIQASLGREVTSRGSAFTIRKFRESPLTCVDLIESGTHTPDSIAFLWLAAELRCNMVVMGATASGKTTTLNALSQFIPPTEKIVSIEDTRELKLWHENWLPAVTRDGFTTSHEDRIGMYDLLRAALRQRPDYLIVGEIRGEEGLTLFQAMATGHTCYSTMHAGSVENAVHRMENKPIGVPRVMLASLDFFILQGQVDVGGRSARKMLSLTEINGVEAASRNLRTNELFRWDADDDALRNVAQSHSLDRARAARGWSQRRLDREFEARRAVIETLVENEEREFDAVAKAVARFYHENRDDPESAEGDAPREERH